MPTAENVIEPALLTKRDIAGRLKVSVRQVDRLVAAGELPVPMKVGKRASRWREQAVADYVNRLAN